MVKKKNNNYLNNRELYDVILTFKRREKAIIEEGGNPPPIPEYVGKCIKLICEKMGTRFNFCGYSFRDEMVGDAILDCVNGFHNFDAERFNNPFGYFSMISWNAMVRKIFTEKRETYLKHKTFINSNLIGEDYESHPDWVNPNAARPSTTSGETIIGLNSISGKVVGDFEVLLEKRKMARKKKVKAE